MRQFLMVKKIPISSNNRAERSSRRKQASVPGRGNAYGDRVPICMNIGCVLRKKSQCYGFEGCPGFKGK